MLLVSPDDRTQSAIWRASGEGFLPLKSASSPRGVRLPVRGWLRSDWTDPSTPRGIGALVGREMNRPAAAPAPGTQRRATVPCAANRQIRSDCGRAGDGLRVGSFDLTLLTAIGPHGPMDDSSPGSVPVGASAAARPPCPCRCSRPWWSCRCRWCWSPCRCCRWCPVPVGGCPLCLPVAPMLVLLPAVLPCRVATRCPWCCSMPAAVVAAACRRCRGGCRCRRCRRRAAAVEPVPDGAGAARVPTGLRDGETADGQGRGRSQGRQGFLGCGHVKLLEWKPRRDRLKKAGVKASCFADYVSTRVTRSG